MASENYPSDHPVFLGIDVSKRALDLCCLAAGHEPMITQVSNDKKGFQQIMHWLKELGVERARVCLEATSQYSTAPALFFHDLGWNVYLLNPAVVHAALGGTQRRTKTDVADARDLAYFLEGHHRRLRCWKPLEAVYQQLRWYVREIAMTTRSIAKAKVALEKVAFMNGEAQRHITQKLQADLAHHAAQRDRLDQHLMALIHNDPALQARFNLLTTAPGVAKVTATSYMSEVPDPSRFQNKRQLAAHTGLTPKLRHSGAHRPASQPISRIGNAYMRAAMYMASLTAGRYESQLRQVDLRLKARGKSPKQAKLAVARRLAEMLYSMEKHNRPYDPDYKAKKLNQAGAI